MSLSMSRLDRLAIKRPGTRNRTEVGRRDRGIRWSGQLLQQRVRIAAARTAAVVAAAGANFDFDRDSLECLLHDGVSL